MTVGASILERLRSFSPIWHNRFEDLERSNWVRTVYCDLSAGLIVAMTAVPMAMGFAMAAGLRPKQGIIAGALACLIGRTFGGSKYQVYGPTAAFIPVIAGLMTKYGETGGGSFQQAHGFLVLASMAAGVMLLGMGLPGLGRLSRLVPSSIVVGFTIGIAMVIALSNLGEALGLQSPLRGGLPSRIGQRAAELGTANGWAVLLTLLPFLACRYLLRISVFIPAPLLALGICTLLSATLLADKGIPFLRDRYGAIPNNSFLFTPPSLPGLEGSVILDLLSLAVAIVFVSGVESLLCSSMADRLAQNRRTRFNPDKELWGQGMAQILTPLINGFPCTGARARTATSPPEPGPPSPSPAGMVRNQGYSHGAKKWTSQRTIP